MKHLVYHSEYFVDAISLLQHKQIPAPSNKKKLMLSTWATFLQFICFLIVRNIRGSYCQKIHIYDDLLYTIFVTPLALFSQTATITLGLFTKCLYDLE